MFSDYIGQNERLTALKSAILSARNTGSNLPDMLILGSSGLGKTHLARSIAQEMNQPFHVVHAPSITEPNQLAQNILKVGKGILFIDEIHALNRAMCEDLYTVIDNNEIAIETTEMVLGKVPVSTQDPQYLLPGMVTGIRWEERLVETKKKVLEYRKIESLTVIGATTDEALLPSPFYNRLSRLKVYLRDYDEVELATIGIIYADELGGRIDNDASLSLAQRSLGNPRRMKQLVERSLDLGPLVTVAVADMAVDSLGVDVLGLEPPHRAILAALLSTDGLSRTSLGQKVGLPPKNLAHYWTDLLKLGLVTIDTRHRLTDSGKEHIQ